MKTRAEMNKFIESEILKTTRIYESGNFQKATARSMLLLLTTVFELSERTRDEKES